MNTTRVEVFNGEAPENLLEFRAWLDAQITQVPEEHRASAKIEPRSDYDGEVWVVIFYTRPETPEEAWQRETRTALRSAETSFSERFFLENVRRLHEWRAFTAPLP